MMETRQRSEFPTEIGPPLSSWCWIILATLIRETRIYLTARVSHVQVHPTLEIAHVILDELTNEGRNCATQLAPRSPSLRRVCFPHTMLTGNCQWCIMVHPSTSSTAGSLDKPWLVAVVTSSLTRTDQPKGSERTIETTWSMRRTVVLHGFRFSWAELGFENRMEGICPENFRCWLSGASYSTLWLHASEQIIHHPQGQRPWVWSLSKSWPSQPVGPNPGGPSWPSLSTHLSVLVSSSVTAP